MFYKYERNDAEKLQGEAAVACLHLLLWRWPREAEKNFEMRTAYIQVGSNAPTSLVLLYRFLFLCVLYNKLFAK
jgi:hypothetical protein